MALTVYRAAAGSGKTFTLVRDYLRLAMGPGPADGFKHILAITFTNKAAGEMKNRVLLALAEFAGRSSAGKFDAMRSQLESQLQLEGDAFTARAEAVLTSMLHRYQQLSIGTIDSFVARIARQFANELLLDQQFEIVLDQALILRQTVDRLLARLGEDERLTQLLVGFAAEQMDDDKSWDIRHQLIHFAQLLMRDQMRNILPRLRKLETQQFRGERDKLRAARAALLVPIQTKATAVVTRLTEMGISADDMFQGKNGVFAQFQKLAHGSTDLNSYLPKAIEKNKWEGGKVDPATKALLQAEAIWLSAEATALLGMAAAVGERVALIDAILDRQYAMATLALLQQEYEGWMEENAAAPLNSLYFRIAELLAETSTPFIYERLGNRYRHFLIDEFQDTSVLQWQNMQPLVENGLSFGYDSLLVGDAKQSIYRWRSGDAAQFVQLPKPYAGAAASAVLEDSYRAASLQENFRSYKQIIDFNNQYFEWRTQNQDNLLREFYTSLAQRGGKPGGYVNVALLPAVEKGEDRDAPRIAHILSLVTSLQAQGVPLGELAILTRTNDQGSAVAVALLEAGLPVISSDSLLLGKQPIIRLVMGLFRWLHEPQDRIIAQACLWLLHQISGQPLQAGDQLIPFMQRHYGPVPSQRWRMLPLIELPEQMLHYFGLLGQANPFVLRLIDLIAEKSRQYDNLAELLDWWDDKGQSASLQMPERGDAVRVMTYHKAKGLEFGVVIVANADLGKTELNEKETWIETPLSPVEVALVGKSKLKTAGAPYAAIHAEEELMTEIDYVNMLYVAFTRAVGGLYILGRAPKSPAKGKDAKESYSFSDNWELFLTSQGHPLDQAFEIGSLPSFPAPALNNDLVLTGHYWQDWRDKIQLQNHFEGSKDVGSALSVGKMTHDLLAALEDERGVESGVAQMLAAGTLTQESVDLLLPAVRKLLKRPNIAPWFAPGLDVRNELSILSPGGEQHRPDRLIIQGNKAHVLEFKTGMPRPSHQKQLDGYMDLLRQMGFEASGELVYLDIQLG